MNSKILRQNQLRFLFFWLCFLRGIFSISTGTIKFLKGKVLDWITASFPFVAAVAFPLKMISCEFQESELKKVARVSVNHTCCSKEISSNK